ncbi:MAG: hypothetical protein FJY80_08165 [Candidatus Aminicenantes bacterium]|nr:hypothetical protein [Candidatus Aminicenantes bacterium]
MSALTTAAALAAGFWLAVQGRLPSPLLPPASELPGGWTVASPPEIYEKEGLYGYINGGSEVFLQYDFRRVDVGRYRKDEAGRTKDITLDVFRMGSDREAFGIFSVQREGGERSLDLGGAPNWTTPSQASLAAGPVFVNIIGVETSAEDMVEFLRLMGKRLADAGNPPFRPEGRAGPWTGLPRRDLQEDTLRYLQGPLAAQGESEILAAPFWGFGSGTVGASARYSPDSRKLVLLEFPAAPGGLLELVRGVFAQHLAEVKAEGSVLEGKSRAGQVFLFGERGRRAALVFGKKDGGGARALLAEALK